MKNWDGWLIVDSLGSAPGFLEEDSPVVLSLDLVFGLADTVSSLVSFSCSFCFGPLLAHFSVVSLQSVGFDLDSVSHWKT